MRKYTFDCDVCNREFYKGEDLPEFFANLEFKMVEPREDRAGSVPVVRSKKYVHICPDCARTIFAILSSLENSHERSASV